MINKELPTNITGNITTEEAEQYNQETETVINQIKNGINNLSLFFNNNNSAMRVFKQAGTPPIGVKKGMAWFIQS